MKQPERRPDLVPGPHVPPLLPPPPNGPGGTCPVFPLIPAGKPPQHTLPGCLLTIMLSARGSRTSSLRQLLLWWPSTLRGTPIRALNRRLRFLTWVWLWPCAFTAHRSATSGGVKAGVQQSRRQLCRHAEASKRCMLGRGAGAWSCSQSVKSVTQQRHKTQTTQQKRPTNNSGPTAATAARWGGSRCRRTAGPG